MDIRQHIRSFPDFPQKGVIFRDITPILKTPEVYRYVVDELARGFSNKPFDYVVGIESRGFIFAISIAERYGKGFIPVRKKGKLPGDTIALEYDIEYGKAVMEMQADAIPKASRAIIVDDLLATGGTALAAAKLVEQLGGKVQKIGFVIELLALKGRDKLKGYDVFSLVSFD